MRSTLMLWAIILAGCATTPEPQLPALQPDKAAIGIAIQMRPPLPLGVFDTAGVYFAGANDDGEPDLSKLYATHLASGGRAYALSVPPGRYVAVAAIFKPALTGAQYIVYLPHDLVVESATQADAGRLTFAGRYLVDTTIGVCPGKADPLELRIAEAVSPGVPKCGLLLMAIHETLSNPVVVVGGSAFPLTATYHYGGLSREAHRDDDSRRAFGQAAKADLRGTGWDSTADR
jgi:hypothetical protein